MLSLVGIVLMGRRPRRAAGGRADATGLGSGLSLRAAEQSTVDQYAANITRLMPSLFGKSGRPVPSGKGILMVHVQGYIANKSTEEPESVTAGRLLRIQVDRMLKRQRVPMAIAGDNATLTALQSMGHLHLWDRTVELHTDRALQTFIEGGLANQSAYGGGLRSREDSLSRVESRFGGKLRVQAHNSRNGSKVLKVFFLWKLLALASSPYSETLFVDNDVLVLNPLLVRDLLLRSLHLSDFVAITDPARPEAYTWEYYKKLQRSEQGANVMDSPPMYRRAVPPLCTALMAFRRTPSVEQLLLRAAARLALYMNPYDPTQRPFAFRVRQSDQEMLWFQLSAGEPDPLLRVFALPEEYLCPAYWPNHPLGNNNDLPYYHYIYAIAAGRTPTWSTRWGSYDCHATHFHHAEHHLANARPAIDPAVAERFHQRLGRRSTSLPSCHAPVSPLLTFANIGATQIRFPGRNCTHYVWSLAGAMPDGVLAKRSMKKEMRNFAARYRAGDFGDR